MLGDESLAQCVSAAANLWDKQLAQWRADNPEKRPAEYPRCETVKAMVQKRKAEFIQGICDGGVAEGWTEAGAGRPADCVGRLQALVAAGMPLLAMDQAARGEDAPLAGSGSLTLPSPSPSPESCLWNESCLICG
eukprot:TRINITY_DN5926_c0_g1_i5.p1 TRINITY_DN5926_c0_g1~~TRINITY_DN5926_c0_g1_i5.p1  ORF type:complete len:135 (+),score=19.94 TRINITY_DN5926_c0_g1_i5:471-875(+)